jgi:hypothetical protein
MTLRVSSSRQEGVYIAFGDKDVVATVTRGTTTDGEDVVQLPPGATHVAAITSHGAAEVKFTRGLADGEEPFDLKAWSKQAAEQAAANLRERTRPRR